MIDKRPFDSLGQHKIDWLHARHHFSFGRYIDRTRMGWGALRVWNDDEIIAGGGFDPHPHQDMEIITYVRSGAITHRDNLGNEGRTEAGDVQVMSAGTGIIHSEFNQEDETTTLFQIWIEPDQTGATPRWESAQFPKNERAGELVVLASNNPQIEGGLLIHQDAKVIGASLNTGQTVKYPLQPGRHVYLVVADGAIDVNGVSLQNRDAVAIKDEVDISISARENSEIVLVDTL